MSVISAIVRLPIWLPISTMVRASLSASSALCINAPLPAFTSSTMASAPEASFLLIMLEAMSGMPSTVPVTSLSAYISLSAGTRFFVCPITQRPISATICLNLSIVSSTLTPGTDSSLSSVPPVWPSPRPLIFATVPPHAATRGAAISVVESPTPPVECLSTFTPARSSSLTISPEFIMAKVSSLISRLVMPSRHTAIIHADI